MIKQEECLSHALNYDSNGCVSLQCRAECSLIWIRKSHGVSAAGRDLSAICFCAGICIDTIPSAHCCIMNFNWLLPGAVINQELLARAIHTRTYYNMIWKCFSHPGVSHFAPLSGDAAFDPAPASPTDRLRFLAN
jgi:hypothetical protein